MSHCHHEAESHGGVAGHHDHDHSHDETPALQSSLYQQIDFDKIETENEEVEGSGRAIIKKEWKDRMQVEPELRSECDDPRLVIRVRFTQAVSIQAVLFRTADAPSSPRQCHLFTREGLSLEDCRSSRPEQVLELSRTGEVQEVPVRRARFTSVYVLTLYFPSNFASAPGGDNDDDEEDEDEDDDVTPTRISYIGFKGSFFQSQGAPKSYLFEAAARPSDHEVRSTDVKTLGSTIGGRGGRHGM